VCHTFQGLDFNYRLGAEGCRYIFGQLIVRAPRNGQTKIMFTGLIEEIGTLLGVSVNEQGRQLQLLAPRIAQETQNGDSIAVNGCCLTVVAHGGGEITFDLLEETLNRTNFRTLRRESGVNLERALLANGRVGGHFVQGHVDSPARVLALDQNGTNQRLEIELPTGFAHYVSCKGSIAVNGISLTVAEISEKSFTTWIVPYTSAQTNIGTTAVDDLVNLEFDLIAKYLERMVDRHVSRSA
jgi:riboflavin synthase